MKIREANLHFYRIAERTEKNRVRIKILLKILLLKEETFSLIATEGHWRHWPILLLMILGLEKKSWANNSSFQSSEERKTPKIMLRKWENYCIKWKVENYCILKEKKKSQRSKFICLHVFWHNFSFKGKEREMAEKWWKTEDSNCHQCKRFSSKVKTNQNRFKI